MFSTDDSGKDGVQVEPKVNMFASKPIYEN
jgi:hypothetical protein